MARFSLKDLFIGVTLIAIGIALFGTILFRQPDVERGILLLFVSCSFVGAGIGTPLKHPLEGGLVGFALSLGVFALFVFNIARLD